MSSPNRPPELYHEVMPEDEREHGKFVERNLSGLNSLIDDFKAATALTHWAAHQSRSQPPMSDDKFTLGKWSNIGARAGALYLYGFHRTSQALNDALAKCPSIQPYYDRKDLGAAWKAFDAAFPSFADVRRGAAHPGELYNSASKQSDHAVKDGLDIPGFIKAAPGAQVIVDSSLINGAFTCTIDGKAVSYSPGDKAIAALEDVLRQVRRGLEPAFRHTETLYLKTLQEKQQPRP